MSSPGPSAIRSVAGPAACTAAISGAWVALRIAVDKLLADKALAADPIRTQVAAVSCGIHNGAAVLDLDYVEDSGAGCDGNFVLTADGSIVEAFACGTAAVVTPIGRLAGAEFDATISGGGPGELTLSIRDELTGIQTGRVADPHGWMTRLV